MSTYAHYYSSITLELNDDAFFATGGYLLDGFDESGNLDIVCMCISPLGFFVQLAVPLGLTYHQNEYLDRNLRKIWLESKKIWLLYSWQFLRCAFLNSSLAEMVVSAGDDYPGCCFCFLTTLSPYCDGVAPE